MSSPRSRAALTSYPIATFSAGIAAEDDRFFASLGMELTLVIVSVMT